MWLDMEAEWQATYDYMAEVMTSPEVQPYWFQVPFRLINATSAEHNFLYCWDPSARDLWVHPQHPVSIKVNPVAPHDRFDYLINHLPSHCDVPGKKHVATLGGLRISESLGRRYRMMSGGAAYDGIKWCNTNMVANTRVFWPIYDFADRDVWICIAQNDLPYNRIYDQFYRFGVPRPRMRVCSMIHETAWHDMRHFQEIEPATYERVIRRISGISTFCHMIDDIIPKDLPAAFRDWEQYRDYLLENIIEETSRARYKSRWRNQHGEAWHRSHVNEVVCNDIDGTKNHNTQLVKDLARR
jgi:predicted phosphoadenosine phosphosulfate sulfurtransferase